jgi:hypothetical protein
VQQRAVTKLQMVLQPGGAGGLLGLQERAAHRVLAQDPAHAQQLRVDPVGADRGDVRVATLAGQHRQQQRPQQVDVGRGVGRAPRQRALFHPGLEEFGRLEEFDEEGQLAQRGDSRLRIPLHVDPPAEGFDRQRHLLAQGLAEDFRLTRWVSCGRDEFGFHNAESYAIMRLRESSNCRF